MNNNLVKIENLANGVSVIKMQDTKGKNAFSKPFVEDLIHCLDTIRKDKNTRVVILCGTADVFCAGADIDTLRALALGQLKPIDLILSKMMLDLRIPIISAMEGHAIGGGFALGLCADIVILANESRYGCSFMNMGFTPGMGITKLMEHFMSPAIAHELQFTGQFIKGRDLAGKTNFNYILPKEEVLPKASALAVAIAEKKPLAVATLKRYLSIERRKKMEETASIESIMHELTFDQADILKSIEENYVR